VVFDILRAAGRDGDVSAFVDVEGKVPEGTTVFDRPVISGMAALDDRLREDDFTLVLGHGNNSRRKALMAWLEERNARTSTAVHPSAIISPDVEIGTCTTISAGAVVLTGSTLGKGVIVNTSATVDHDCRVGDFAQLAPGCNLAGRVTVGPESFVGIGAVVIQNTTVGEGCVVGASAAVVRDAPAHTLVIGVPARVRKHL